MTERRAALAGLAVASALVLAQVAVGAAWSLSHDDPTYLELTRRCFEREKGLVVEPTLSDYVALSARGGSLGTVVEGNRLTVSIVRSAAEAERIRAAYDATEPEVEARVETRGRYVEHWLRDPSPTQRQTAYDCEY